MSVKSASTKPNFHVNMISVNYDYITGLSISITIPCCYYFIIQVVEAKKLKFKTRLQTLTSSDELKKSPLSTVAGGFQPNNVGHHMTDNQSEHVYADLLKTTDVCILDCPKVAWKLVLFNLCGFELMQN